MPLPTCECVKGLPLPEQLNAIYCALIQILNNGGGGGSITLADISDMSPFWKATLSGTPAADQVFGTDGAGVFTTFDVTGNGVQLLATPTTSGQNVFLTFDSTDVLNLVGAAAAEIIAGGPVFTGTQNPVTEVIVANGMVTSAS